MGVAWEQARFQLRVQRGALIEAGTQTILESVIRGKWWISRPECAMRLMKLETPRGFK